MKDDDAQVIADEVLPVDSPLHQVRKLKAEMSQTIDHLRAGVERVSDRQAMALFETSAEVLSGLVKAFEDFTAKNETAWTSGDRTGR